MLTESEAWEAIADVLEGYGMPPHSHSCHPDAYAFGLCEIVWMLINDGMVSLSVANAVFHRINAELRGRTWLFPRGRVAPRIAIARRFAQESKR